MPPCDVLERLTNTASQTAHGSSQGNAKYRVKYPCSADREQVKEKDRRQQHQPCQIPDIERCKHRASEQHRKNIQVAEHRLHAIGDECRPQMAPPVSRKVIGECGEAREPPRLDQKR